jgi:TctA family transporter
MIIIQSAYEKIEWLIGWILIGITIVLIHREKGKKKWWATIIFLLSGVLGIVVLTNKEIENPLFPLLSGLFGIASLLTSYSHNAKIPPQTQKTQVLNSGKMIKSIINATITGSIFSVLPGVGPSQAAILATSRKKRTTTREFLVLSAGLSAANFIISLLTLYVLNKARNGAVASVGEIIGKITGKETAILLAAIFIASGCAVYLTKKLAKNGIDFMSKMNYKKICVGVLCFLIIMTFILSGWMGIYIAATATAIGLIPVWKKIGRHHAMGSLLLPVILFFIL